MKEDHDRVKSRLDEFAAAKSRSAKIKFSGVRSLRCCAHAARVRGGVFGWAGGVGVNGESLTYVTAGMKNADQRPRRLK